MLRLVILLSFCVIAAAPALAQRTPSRFCGWDPVQLVGRGEFTVNTNLRVRNNGECNFLYNPNGADPMTIVQRPANGTLRMTGNFTFQYIPRAGYLGSDVFSVRLPNPTTGSFATIRYNVTVNPPGQ
jgi:hypothetical protein